MREVIQHPAAARDLTSIVRYLAWEAGRAKAREFISEIQTAYQLLARMPHIGAPRTYDNPALQSLRIWLVPNFRKYIIFYLVGVETLTIVRVLHGSRDVETILSDIREI